MCQNRFVILLHQTAADEHWDVMLETDSALTTWSISPQKLTGKSFVCSAKRLADHRKDYLDYEGTISGNRGTVTRIDTGTYDQISLNQFMIYGTLFSGKLIADAERLTFAPLRDHWK
jgi:hypothetical protein